MFTCAEERRGIEGEGVVEIDCGEGELELRLWGLEWGEGVVGMGLELGGEREVWGGDLEMAGGSMEASGAVGLGIKNGFADHEVG